jgi:hypothetical protein
VGRRLSFEKKTVLNWSIQDPENGPAAIGTVDLSGRVIWGGEYPLRPYIGLLHTAAIGRTAAVA